ncbi:muscle M-line assembly protein unc-89-like [Ornithorhynchus anatinus]|nr:muscle M-line assembly protein unc-89-like [Ornithorhynchus anatinus]
MRAAFSDSEDCLDHNLVAAKRYASRISSTSSWPENFKPTFTQKLMFKYVLEGEPVVFECRLIACPAPEMTWFHNNRPIPKSPRRIIKSESDVHNHCTSLLVTEVEERDSGSYRIFAINSEGSAESTASLLVVQKGQDAKYLEFLRRAEQTQENVESFDQQRREDRIKVDLRFIGSPFNKSQDVDQKGMMRTIHFEKSNPIRRQGFVFHDEQLERATDVREWVNVGESFLDEETKMKLQRLREAKRILVERRKLSLSDMSPETGLRSARSQESTKLFQNVSEQFAHLSDSRRSGESVDHSKVTTKRMYQFHAQVDEDVEFGKPSKSPKNFPGDRIGEELTQIKTALTQAKLPRETPVEHSEMIGKVSRITEEGEIYCKDIETTQPFEAIIAREVTKESPESTVNVHLGEEIHKTTQNEDGITDTINSDPSELVLSLENSSENIELSKERVRQENLTQIKQTTPGKTHKLKTELEDKATGSENLSQKRFPRCPPSFVHEIESWEVNEGESCIFNCYFQGCPQPIVTWYKNDIPIPRNQGYIIHSTENHSTLTFSSVLPEDEGSITCVLFNQYGTVKTSGLLKVKAKASFESDDYQMLQDYTEEEEEVNLAFGCKEENMYLPPSSWEDRTHLPIWQANTPVPPTAESDSLSFPVEIQVIAATPTPEQDKELRDIFEPVEFEPEAKSQDYSHSHKHKFKFSFDVTNEPPKLIREMPKYISYREGDPVALECLISGEPRPVVTWFQNGRALNRGQKFRFEEDQSSYRLHIDEVTTLDSGVYECVAENKAGIVASACDLTVESVIQSFDSYLRNIGSIEEEVHTSRQIQAKVEKPPLRDHSISFYVCKSKVQERSVPQHFQSLEALQQIYWRNEERCKSSKEELPRFMGVMKKSVTINEAPLPAHPDVQWPSKEKEQTKAVREEDTVYSFYEDFIKVKSVKESEEQFGQPEDSKVENRYKGSTREHLSNIKLESTIESYTGKDSSIIKSEEPLGEETASLRKNGKSDTITPEEGQVLEKPCSEEYSIGSARPEMCMAYNESSVGKPLSNAREVKMGDRMFSGQLESELDTYSIVMDLKSLSSQIDENFQDHHEVEQEEMYFLDQSPTSGRVEPEAYCHKENLGDTFQEPDGVQPEETVGFDASNVVFDLKQMYSHVGHRNKQFPEQSLQQQEEKVLKDESSGLEPVKIISPGISENGQHTKSFEEQDVSYSQEFSDQNMILLGKYSIQAAYVEKEGPQIHDLKTETTDLSLNSPSEGSHQEAFPSFHTSSLQTQDSNLSEEVSHLEPEDDFISSLKKAAREKKHLNIPILKEEEEEKTHRVSMESTSFCKDDTEICNYDEVFPKEHQNTAQEIDATNRKLSVSQYLPFLRAAECLDQIGQMGEEVNVSQNENRYEESRIERENSVSSNEAISKAEEGMSTNRSAENISETLEVNTIEGKESEPSLTKYLLAAGKEGVPEKQDSSSQVEFFQEGSITSMEVEEVTFSTVYAFYNQQQESSVRPFSPESDMSIEVASTSSEESPELDQFFTPPSSVENFETPTSHESCFTPVETPEVYSTPSGGEPAERYSTPSGKEKIERYATPSGGESIERYSTPSGGESAERYATPSGGESVERYATPSGGESIERYATPSGGESFERYSTPEGEPLERYSTPSGGESLKRYSTPSGGRKTNVNLRNLPSSLEREDSTPNELYHTPTGERSSAYELWRSESFGTPNEAIEPKGNEMPPAFIAPLTKRQIYENTTLGFIVEVVGLPVPGVKWYRNKSLLEPDDRVKIERVGDVCSLEICNVQKTEEGDYMCHAVNIIGEAKSFAKVDILPQERRAIALPCPVTHQHVMEFDLEKNPSSRTPSPQEIILEVELGENDVKEFEKQVKIVAMPEFTPDHKSMIVSLDVLPMNLVETNMAFGGKEDSELKIDLEVVEMPPRFTTPICDCRIPQNSEAVLECSLIGIPTPEVKWYKEYTCIKPDGIKYVVTADEGSHTLKIRNISLMDSAIYRCRAVNSVGEAICRSSLTLGEPEMVAVPPKKSKVTVSSSKEKAVLKRQYSDKFFEFLVTEGPPKFIKALSDCSSPLGTAAYFQCLVRGSPKPNIRWYRGDRMVQGDSRFSMEESGTGFHNLFITSLAQDDEGEYRCVATNALGTAESCAVLTLS